MMSCPRFLSMSLFKRRFILTCPKIFRNHSIMKNSSYTSMTNRMFSSTEMERGTIMNATTKNLHHTDMNENSSESETNSSSNSNDENNSIPVKDMILDAALRHVNDLGWTNTAIAAGAVELGFSPASNGLFQRGPVELVEYFMVKGNREMIETMKASYPVEEIGVTETIKTAIKLRLLYIQPYMTTWSQAMALGALPQNVTSTLKNICDMSDDIWYIAGDESTDINWYTKRSLISGVYVSTELFMLSDTSKDYEATWDFLERRLEDVMNAGGVMREGSQIASTFLTGFEALATGVASVLQSAPPMGSTNTGGAPSPKDIFASTPIARHISTAANVIKDNMNPPPFAPLFKSSEIKKDSNEVEVGETIVVADKDSN
jgi:rpsU-divergently transcribed protein